MEKKWIVTFKLPEECIEVKGVKRKVKDRSSVTLTLDEETLHMLLHDIVFFHEEIYKEDIKSFVLEGADTGIYSRYKIEYRQIDFNEREALFELSYEYY